MTDQLDGNAVAEASEDAVHSPDGVAIAIGSGPQDASVADELGVVCGPLINYQGQGLDEEGGTVTWRGSVLIVTNPGQKVPQLELEPEAGSAEKAVVQGLKLYSDPDKTFWRFSLAVPLTDVEARWRYTIPDARYPSSVSKEPSRVFVVPAATESMRIMFHSCNGFSVGTDEDFWSGPAVWNDVLRTHQKRPFHVMIGGGDQIYNDSVRVSGPLKPWTAIGNPRKRREFPFDNKMRADCDEFYYKNYVRWYTTEPFASANASIPQINIWDDHDIIDGFGSYTDHFMRCAVFRGIGGVAFKYYSLFQHHTAPPASTFTTDAPQTMSAGAAGTAGVDPRQIEKTYVYKGSGHDPSWIVGTKHGPYVEERSRSLYMRLGKRIAFCGIDARTERTRKQVNYPETYDLIFNRLRAELGAARGEIKHLILLLGVPIAYPRLAWLENILSSPIIAPIKLLNKRFGFAGGLFNAFDGSVDLLDDLDDHYTARRHKKERRELVVRLQQLSQDFSIRVTILGGDVHLGALGRFYSNPEVNIAPEHDPRYMANIISSAITNKPPPKAVANLLARRNKIHHLRDGKTDETLLALFNKQPGGILKSAPNNYNTMPSRNYATITEISNSGQTDDAGPQNGVNGNVGHKTYGHDGHHPLHAGEDGAGTDHPAADGVSSQGVFAGGLNVALRVEIDNQDRQGKTEGYGLSIPPLSVEVKPQ
ncbi:hypothetical protein DV737_g5668, partial [Chaetothyriales sp. CBS 132003]